MPQLIEVPGYGPVEFPDGMTDDQIVAAIKANELPEEPSSVVGAVSRQLRAGVGQTLGKATQQVGFQLRTPGPMPFYQRAALEQEGLDPRAATEGFAHGVETVGERIEEAAVEGGEAPEEAAKRGRADVEALGPTAAGVARGVGQFGGQVAVGAVAGAPTALVVGGLNEAEGFREDAQALGADEATQQAASVVGGFLGVATEWAPLKLALGKFKDLPGGDWAVKKLAGLGAKTRGAVEITAVGVGESLQEGTMAVAQNLTASDWLGYDKDRPWEQDLAPTMLEGGGAGLIVGGLSKAARAQRKKAGGPVPPSRAATPTKTPAEAAATPPPDPYAEDPEVSKLNRQIAWAAGKGHENIVKRLKAQRDERVTVLHEAHEARLDEEFYTSPAGIEARAGMLDTEVQPPSVPEQMELTLEVFKDIDQWRPEEGPARKMTLSDLMDLPVSQEEASVLHRVAADFRRRGVTEFDPGALKAAMQAYLLPLNFDYKQGDREAQDKLDFEEAGRRDIIITTPVNFTSAWANRFAQDGYFAHVTGRMENGGETFVLEGLNSDLFDRWSQTRPEVTVGPAPKDAKVQLKRLEYEQDFLRNYSPNWKQFVLRGLVRDLARQGVGALRINPGVMDERTQGFVAREFWLPPTPKQKTGLAALEGQVSPTLRRAAALLNEIRGAGFELHYLGNEDYAITRIGDSPDSKLEYEAVPDEINQRANEIVEAVTNKPLGWQELKQHAAASVPVPVASNDAPFVVPLTKEHASILVNPFASDLKGIDVSDAVPASRRPKSWKKPRAAVKEHVSPTQVRAARKAVEGRAERERFDSQQQARMEAHAREVQAWLKPVMQHFPKGPVVHVVDTAEEIGVSREAMGRFVPETNEVFIVASNVKTRAQAIVTYMHEVAGHYGLRNLLGDQFVPSMLAIYRTNPRIREKADAYFESHGAQLKEFRDGLAYATEEVLAYSTEQDANRNVKGLARLTAALRALLRRLGVVKSWTDNDTRYLLDSALKFARTGKASQVTRPGRHPPTERVEDPKVLVYQDEVAKILSAKAFDVDMGVDLNGQEIIDSTPGSWDLLVNGSARGTAPEAVAKAIMKASKRGPQRRGPEFLLSEAGGRDYDPDSLYEPLRDLASLEDVINPGRDHSDTVTFNAFLDKVVNLEQLAKLNPNDTYLQLYIDKVRAHNAFKSNWAMELENRIVELKALSAETIQRVFDFALDVTYASSKIGRRITEAELAQLATSGKVVLNGPGRQNYPVEAVKLNEGELRAYLKVDGDFKSALDQIKQLMDEGTNRRLAGQSPAVLEAALATNQELHTSMLNRNYFPLARFGDYTNVVTAREDTTYEGETYKAGQVVEVSTYESARKQKKAIKELQEEYPESRFRITPRRSTDTGGQRSVYLPPQLEARLQTDLQLNEVQKQALAEIFVDLQPSRAFAKRLKKQRKAVAGFSRDGLRAYADYFMRFSSYAANMKYADDFEAAINDHNKLAPESQDSVKWDGVTRWMREHKEYLLNPETEWATLRKLVSVWNLGLNVRAAMVNLTQIPMFVYPYLASRYGGDAKAVGNIGSGSAKLVAIQRYLSDAARGSNRIHATQRALPDGLPQVLIELTSQQILDQGFAVHMAGVADGDLKVGALYGFKGGPSAWLHQGMDKSMWLFQQMEKINRRVTAAATFPLALEDVGGPKAKWGDLTEAQKNEVVKQCREAVTATQFDYSRWNRPKFLRGRKGAAFVFYNYTTNALFFMLKEPGRGRMFALQLMAGGLLGIPFAEDVLELLDATIGFFPDLAEKLGIPKDFDLNSKQALRNFIKDKLPDTESREQVLDMILHGAGHEYGGGPFHFLTWAGIPIPRIDISGSLSQGDILPGTKSIRALARGATGDQMRKVLIEDFANAGGALFNNLLDSLSSSDSGFRRVQRAMPAAMKKMYEAYQALDKGEFQRRDYSAIRKVDWQSGEDQLMVLATGFGFRPTEISNVQAKDFTLYEASTFWQTRKSLRLKVLREAVLAHDAKGKQQGIQAIRDYNKYAPPSYRVTSESISRSIGSALRRRALREETGATTKAAIPLAREIYEDDELVGAGDEGE